MRHAQLVEQLELPGTHAGWVKPTWGNGAVGALRKA
nr:MAG TPA: hypothetical protein [Caudoviricetes sp.]